MPLALTNQKEQAEVQELVELSADHQSFACKFEENMIYPIGVFWKFNSIETSVYKVYCLCILRFVIFKLAVKSAFYFQNNYTYLPNFGKKFYFDTSNSN